MTLEYAIVDRAAAIFLPAFFCQLPLSRPAVSLLSVLHSSVLDLSFDATREARIAFMAGP